MTHAYQFSTNAFFPVNHLGWGDAQTFFEACDDGANNSGYGFCTPDCKARGAYCGDGKVDAQNGEQCDGTPDCTPACRFVVFH